MKKEEIIEKFQCPGCVCGCGVDCEIFEIESYVENEFHCRAHVPGTTMVPGGRLYLGLPKGFNKLGCIEEGLHHNIRMWLDGSNIFNRLNIPVWYIKEDGFTIVRTFIPRLNVGYIDIIVGDFDLPESCIDVAEFKGEID